MRKAKLHTYLLASLSFAFRPSTLLTAFSGSHWLQNKQTGPSTDPLNVLASNYLSDTVPWIESRLPHMYLNMWDLDHPHFFWLHNENIPEALRLISAVCNYTNSASTVWIYEDGQCNLIFHKSWTEGTNLSLSAVNITLRSSSRDPNTRRSSRRLRQENRHSKSTCSRRESEGLQSSITWKKKKKEKWIKHKLRCCKTPRMLLI